MKYGAEGHLLRTFARVTRTTEKTADSTADKTGNAAQPQDSSGNRGYGFERKRSEEKVKKNFQQPVIQVFNHNQGIFQEIQNR